VAGAGAAAIVLVARELMAGPRDERATEVPDVLDELLNGAGRGIVYAAVVDPFLPGGPVLKGVLAGTLDSLAAPIGGLFARLQPLSPVHRIPVVSALLTIDASETDPFLKHLCNGVLLGLLYGDSGG
jgi:hypothetical protein